MKLHYYLNGCYMGKVGEKDANKIIDKAHKQGASILHEFDHEESIKITTRRESTKDLYDLQ